ncbi:MAG: hypothetical protein SOZ38_00285 [Oscillospiraceae bacterium]|nr:hypothetical protein [Oscillospiraceae bacterium]
MSKTLPFAIIVYSSAVFFLRSDRNSDFDLSSILSKCGLNPLE